MMTAVIVDDEENAVEALAFMLADNCPNVRVVGKALSCGDAVQLIRESRPHLVFLDIEMPRQTGFSVLEAFPERDFAVIFVTAYDQYAIQAIKFSALDYLLKPVGRKELVLAVERAERARASTISLNRNFRVLRDNLTSELPETLALPVFEGFEFVRIKDILRVEASGRYSEVHFLGGKSLTVSRNLGEFEKLLNGLGFHRVHHSHLVSLTHTKSYLRQDGGTVVMTDGTHVPVARSKKEAFLKRMKSV
jgi:two-component system LytT family response regulator